MIKSIIKRDGRRVKFRSEKLTTTIYNAMTATGEGSEEDAKRLAGNIVRQLERAKKVPHVEEVQDRTEITLMRNNFHRAAKAYIVYRKQHDDLREISSLIQDTDMIEGYLNKSDWMVKENSNMTYSLQGLNNYLSSKVISNYWLHKLYPPEIRSAHKEGDFHLHDLGTLGPYCVGWNLPDVLERGFMGVPGKVHCKPPKHFKSALGQIVNYLYTLQGESAGAQAFSNIDTYLAPFIRADNLSERDVRQTMQEFIFNLNVPTRVGFQTPFVNFTQDLIVPKFMEDEPAIIGGKYDGEKLSDYQDEMDLFNAAFGETMCAGDGNGNPFTFPIPTINITKDFDWGNEKLDPIWEMTSKYGIPYFSNFVNSEMSPEDVRSMCCRLRIDNRELLMRGGGLFGANPLTGSVGVVTVNMGRIGYLSKSKDDYFERLDYLMDLAKESLEIKRQVIDNFTKNGLYPYSRVYLQSVFERYGTYWQNHFSTIGLIGMNESIENYMGCSIGDDEGRSFALEVLDHMRDRLSIYQELTGHLYNLESTPAEGTTYRLAKMDVAKYPDIKTASLNGGEPYYTNSTQLPVHYTSELFKALQLQDDIQCKYTGGTVLHLYLQDEYPPPESVANLVKKVTDNFHLPYFTVTPTYSVCPNHGYQAGRHDQCDRCGAANEVYSRVVGYLRPVSQWNLGKRTEFEERQTFNMP